MPDMVSCFCLIEDHHRLVIQTDKRLPKCYGETALIQTRFVCLSFSDPHSVNIPMKDMSITYHASSPDEVALVQWTEKVGMTLLFRDIKSIKLRNPLGQMMHFEILDIFPFSSETKRMGIIVKDLNTKEIVFYLKGADTVMSSIITYSDWLQEQCDNMARSGLRTLVVAKKLLDEEQYTAFQELYNQAKCNMNDRASRIRTVLATLEKDMELLCLTGQFLYILFV